MNQQPSSMTTLSNEEIDQVSGGFFCFNPFSLVSGVINTGLGLLGGLFGGFCPPAPCPPAPPVCPPDGTDQGPGPRRR